MRLITKTNTDTCTTRLKTRTNPFFLAVTSEHHSISIIDELALVAIWKGQRLRAAPGDFEHGAERSPLGTADGACAQEIPARHGAAVDGVVGELLRGGPLHGSHSGVSDREGLKARRLD